MRRLARGIRGGYRQGGKKVRTVVGGCVGGGGGVGCCGVVDLENKIS